MWHKVWRFTQQDSVWMIANPLKHVHFRFRQSKDFRMGMPAGIYMFHPVSTQFLRRTLLVCVPHRCMIAELLGPDMEWHSTHLCVC